MEGCGGSLAPHPDVGLVELSPGDGQGQVLRHTATEEVVRVEGGPWVLRMTAGVGSLVALTAGGEARSLASLFQKRLVTNSAGQWLTQLPCGSLQLVEKCYMPMPKFFKVPILDKERPMKAACGVALRTSSQVLATPHAKHTSSLQALQCRAAFEILHVVSSVSVACTHVWTSNIML
jgi:hypothetical protein